MQRLARWLATATVQRNAAMQLTPRVRAAVWLVTYAVSIFLLYLSSQREWLTQFIAVDSFIVVMLGVVVTVFTPWTDRNKIWVVIAFGLLGGLGTWATIREASDSDHERREGRRQEREAARDLSRTMSDISRVSKQSLDIGNRTIKVQDSILRSVGTVRSEVKEQKATLETGLAHNAETIRRIDPLAAEIPTLEPRFYADNQPLPLVITRRVIDHTVTFSVTVKNASPKPVIAEAVTVWIELPDGLAFTKDPRGFERNPGTSDLMRVKSFSSLLRGVSLPPTEVTIELPFHYGKIAEIRLIASCSRCEMASQILRIELLPE